jgi:hypothetical protein
MASFIREKTERAMGMSAAGAPPATSPRTI